MVIKTAAKTNKVEMKEFTLLVHEEDIKTANQESHMSIFATYAPLFEYNLRKNTLLIMSVWMTFAFLYYGIILFVAKVYENHYGGTATCSFNYPPILENSIAEFAGITIVILVINTIGRVKSQSYGYFIGGIAIIIMGLLGDKKTSVVILAGIARAAAMGASSATWVHTPELFPTNLRASGHSICNVAARLAGFCAPFVVFSSLSFVSVSIILCVASLIAGFAATLLPETAGLTLDDAVRNAKYSSTRSLSEIFQINLHSQKITTENKSLLNSLNERNSSHDI